MKNIHFFKQKNPNQDTYISNSINKYNTITDSIESDWKVYSNKRLGFTFNYPSTWVEIGKSIEVVNLSGNITAIENNFADTVSKATLLLGCHLAPNGLTLYQYRISQYYSTKGNKKIQVAGNEAIEDFTVIDKDGKGNVLNQPLRLVVVDFLDKQKSGEIEFQFQTPLVNESIEVAKFRKILSTFKFL